MKDLGIYVHIPFCKRKCDYCDFISFENKEQLIEQYVKKIQKEILNSENLEDYTVSTIYLGGGTPSYIQSKYIKEILVVINEKFNVSEDAEITIEVNPGTVNKEKLQDYYDAKINRLSIGLQTTKDALLKNLGRIHSYNQFIQTYEMARQVGFKNINVDLMIGLPMQKIEDVKDSLKEIISLNPEHISVYSLILEEGTKLEKKVMNNEVVLPNEELERQMYWSVKNTLEKQEYVQYEISNFSKKGYQSKHNLNCWKQKEYLGFGLVAHSYFNNIRYSNTEKIEDYIKNENKKIIHEIQTKETKMKEYMLLRTKKNRRSKNIRI